MSASPDDKRPGEEAASAKQVTALTKAVEGLAGQLAAATRYGRRNRHMIRGLWVSLGVDVVLTVLVSIVGVQAWQAHDQAEQNRKNQVAVCQSTNQSRAQNLQLWTYVLSIPPATPPTAKQREQREQFRAYLQQVFKPRDCSRL